MSVQSSRQAGAAAAAVIGSSAAPGDPVKISQGGSRPQDPVRTPSARPARDRLASRRRRRAQVFIVPLIAGAAIACVLFALRYGVPRQVVGHSVEGSMLVVGRDGPGTLDAINRSAVSARVQGRIAEIAVDLNETVTKGQVIARIASEDLRSQFQAVVASQGAAKVAILQAKAEQARAEAEVANAEATFRRQAILLERKSTPRGSYDAAQAALRSAEAGLAAAKAAVAEGEAQARSATATVELHRAQLDETTVRAPFDGVVVARAQNAGNIATPGASIVEIVDPSTIVLRARFDESAIASVAPGQRADLRFVSQPGEIIPGHVLRLSRQVDTETREFTVDVVPDELPRNWAIGQRGTAVIAVEVKPDVLSVPSGDIVRQDGEAGLWTLTEGRASWRPVELGEIGGSRVEIRSGLREGDVVLSPGRIFEGMRVRGGGGDAP